MKPLNSPTKVTLYRRLGGYDVIAAVIDEFLSRFRSDPRLARFGGGRSLDSRQRTRQLIVEQICSLAGGPRMYWPRYEDLPRRPWHHRDRVAGQLATRLWGVGRIRRCTEGEGRVFGDLSEV